MEAPILFLIFNRPDTTKGVFEAIRKAKPPKLFVAADGPRPDKPSEWEKCQKVREIATAVDWDCEVKTLFRDSNLGCKVGVSRAIDWFFQHVEEGIILEDDCLPDQSFFSFCQELLEYYRNDTRIMHISGNNFQSGQTRGCGSYYFSKYAHIWGWATWRRAWLFYDLAIKTLPKFIQQRGIESVFQNAKVQKYWFNNLLAVFNGKKDTWDYQWNYSIWSQNGLCILPNANLVTNIGFGAGATHTKDENLPQLHVSIEKMRFPLNHPFFVIRDEFADSYTDKHIFCKRHLLIRLINRFRRYIGWKF